MFHNLILEDGKFTRLLWMWVRNCEMEIWWNFQVFFSLSSNSECRQWKLAKRNRSWIVMKVRTTVDIRFFFPFSTRNDINHWHHRRFQRELPHPPTRHFMATHKWALRKISRWTSGWRLSYKDEKLFLSFLCPSPQFHDPLKTFVHHLRLWKGKQDKNHKTLKMFSYFHFILWNIVPNFNHRMESCKRNRKVNDGNFFVAPNSTSSSPPNRIHVVQRWFILVMMFWNSERKNIAKWKFSSFLLDYIWNFRKGGKKMKNWEI